MKKILFLAFLLLLVPTAFALSGTGIDEQMSILTEPMAVQNGFIPQPLDCNQATGTVVAIDISKAQETDDAQNFINDLNTAGYYVATVDVSTQAGRDALSCVHVLVIWSLKNNVGISGIYTNEEVDTIENFVTSGGGFFFLSDWGGFASSTANLIARFGIVVDQNTATDSNDNDNGNSWWPIYEADNFIPSPIFDGVSAHEQLAGTSFIVGQGSPLIPVVKTDNDGSAYPQNAPVVAAGFYQQGCMVVTGDSNWLQEFVDGYQKVDNDQFALNIVDFLTRCNPGDVNIPEFGLIGGGIAIIGALCAFFVLRRR
ncbi:MAG: hypothetical protein V1743_07495 [Nanoarchaeota archaeon]